MTIGVDRQGNVLVLWSRGGVGPQSVLVGQWFDHAGAAGRVFELDRDIGVGSLYERVGNGLFAFGGRRGAPPGWVGQFDPLSTSMSPPPDWLAARPDVTLHMVHGGAGYALLPQPHASPSCEQQVDIVSASGRTCGSSTFTFGGGSCTTSSITVGYDGTVVQRAPREREKCTAADHRCTCTFRYWPAFFR